MNDIFSVQINKKYETSLYCKVYCQVYSLVYCKLSIDEQSCADNLEILQMYFYHIHFKPSINTKAFIIQLYSVQRIKNLFSKASLTKVCQVDYVHLEADLKVFVTLIIAQVGFQMNIINLTDFNTPSSLHSLGVDLGESYYLHVAK